MGIFGFFVHRSTKKQIEKNVDWYRRLTPDLRAGMLFYLWMSRGINLSKVSGYPELFTPIYYYQRGAEVPLGKMISIFEKAQNHSMVNATNHHYFTNLAVSYPDKGYGSLVREMWDALLNDEHTDLREVIDEMRGLIDDPKNKEIIDNNDVSVAALAEQPSGIMPHFLVPGHPLSARLLEEEKMGKCFFRE